MSGNKAKWISADTDSLLQFLSVALGLFLSILDTSIVATSLFAIASDFGKDGGGGSVLGDGDVGALNWVALAYELSYLGCAVLCARMSDVVGRRAAFAAAYVVFVASSLACGFARSMDQLVALRAIQGLGGSGACDLFPHPPVLTYLSH